MSRLIVWRHGETEWNTVRRVQGHADIELSETGRAQAAAAAEVLATLQPVRIVTSDLQRAAQTAAALAALTGAPIQPDQRLRERFYGPWQGLTSAEIAERWPSEFARWRAGDSDLGLGIETREDLAKRSTAAFVDASAAITTGAASAGDGAAEEWGPGGSASVAATVVVVTHGGAARQGCGTLLGWPESVIRTLGALGNCRWSELHFDPLRGWQLRSHNQAWTGRR